MPRSWNEPAWTAAVVTLDKDFGELAVARGAAHHGIIRLVGFSARKPATACLETVVRHESELAAGAIVTAHPGCVRLRLADPKPG